MPALSVNEARIRATSLAVTSYDVQLDLTRGDQAFHSRTTIEFRSRDHQDTFLDVAPAELHSVRLNKRPLDVTELHDGRLHLRDLSDENVVEVEAVMAYSHDGEGLHRAVDPEDDQAYVYAMAFLPAAPRIFACFDQPDLKAPYRVTVRAPEQWTVLGNGAATQVEPGVWSLAETKPLSTYFVTVVAGPYHSLRTEHDGIPLGLHCRQSLAPHLDKDAEELFAVTAACFDEYHRLFGIRYPFGEYHQAFVPEFNAGAMENPGCVTFSDDLVFKAPATDNFRATRAMVVAHEMAHQWFGDLVTMQWWDDLWLNESFAEYMGYRVTSAVTPFTEVWAEFALSRKAWGMAADQRTSTHPVAGNGARDAKEALTSFDGISYTKGAASLRQLNAYLGDDAFLAGVVDHLHQHSYGNATFADLVQCWEQASGKDVSGWADVWLRTSGVDTLACHIDEDGQAVITRHNGSPSDVSRPHALTVTGYDANGESASTPLLITEPATVVPLPPDGPLRFVLPDSGDQTWAKIALDERSTHQAPHMLQKISDPLARAVVWGALRESLHDGALDPGSYLATLEQALPAESDLAVDVILGAAPYAGAIGALGTYFAAPADRDRLAELADGLLVAASPGSNRQLIAVRAVVDLTRDVERLQRWLDGGAPTGVPVDEDFRWRVLIALCAHGVKGEADIAAETARDRSSQGALHALGCRASIPTTDAKGQVWESLTTDANLSNYELYALAERFFHPDQGDLTAEFVPRYFAEIPSTAQFRSGWMVERTAALVYPRYAASDATVTLAEECLRRPELDTGVRRSVSDRTDDLRRVIRSRVSFSR